MCVNALGLPQVLCTIYLQHGLTWSPCYFLKTVSCIQNLERANNFFVVWLIQMLQQFVLYSSPTSYNINRYKKRSTCHSNEVFLKMVLHIYFIPRREREIKINSIILLVVVSCKYMIKRSSMILLKIIIVQYYYSKHT